ncbi:isoniazid inductible gene protein IniA [Alloactinosynnema sp. L-07]|uniref:dynamin family protein n=1 Tax=Alloactinosynnema sp. L-07 TaxID=1653480 RepID=UPI00065EF635|nr:dynamin family protein [Alloactinosynnema sp. L-07]CRK59515.1 isoniazid inductible gene protein IniA [Alloactinosynnema sp. L-07]
MTRHGTLDRVMAPPWLGILDDTIRACAAHDRSDLAERLLRRRARLLEPGRRVVVFGGAGQGKSQLVNALINAPVCAVGDDITTVVPAVVRHADEPTAAVVTGDARPALSGAVERAAAPIESVSAQANRLALVRDDVQHCEIGLPRTLLGAGLVLIDAPAVGDAHDSRTGRAMSVLADADAVLLVTDATAVLTALELDLLSQIHRLCPTVLVVVTKIDIVPRWRQVAEADRRALAEAGLPTTVVPVSSALRLAAARTEDHALNAESGFADLITQLRQHVLTDPVAVTSKAAAATSKLAVEQLIEPLRAEFDTVAATTDTAALADWHAAGRRVEQLQREAARWQTQLSDDVADLMADVEYDLRDRTRRVLREVDDYFEVADPAKVWDEFEDWMRAALTEIAEVNSDWLLERFEWIAARIARTVVPDAERLPSTLLRDLSAEHASALRKPNIEKFTPVQKMFVGLRGSYSGLLMSGLATTLAGLPLINPISLGAGAAFGARSVFEERGARLKRRQAIAKTSAQRHVDDFFLSYGKETKDAMRVIHRALRDRFAEVAQELREAATESAREIKRDLDAGAALRNGRAAEVRRGLEQLVALRGRIDALHVPKGLTA